MNLIGQVMSQPFMSSTGSVPISLHPGRIVNKTNGITFRRWLIECNPDLAQIIRSALGERALDDYRALKALAAYADNSSLQERMAQARRKRKIALARVIADQLNQRVDPEAVFDVQIKRIHEYKRQLLNILETVALYKIRAQPMRDFVPRVNFRRQGRRELSQAKLIIKLANDVARVVNNDPTVRGLLKVVFLPTTSSAGGGHHSGRRPVRADFDGRHGGVGHREYEDGAQRRADHRHPRRRQRRDRKRSATTTSSSSA